MTAAARGTCGSNAAMTNRSTRSTATGRNCSNETAPRGYRFSLHVLQHMLDLQGPAARDPLSRIDDESLLPPALLQLQLLPRQPLHALFARQMSDRDRWWCRAGADEGMVMALHLPCVSPRVPESSWQALPSASCVRWLPRRGLSLLSDSLPHWFAWKHWSPAAQVQLRPVPPFPLLVIILFSAR